MQRQLFDSASAEHYTPFDIAERIRAVFGEPIDLDPASTYAANASIIRAKRFYSKAQNGLIQDWRAKTLWLNPPYSEDEIDASGNVVISERTKKAKRQRVIREWVERWREAVELREVAQAALLIPARTDTQWFSPLFQYSLCFVTGRLNSSNASNSAPFPTAIAYSGPNVERFYLLFDEIGRCGRLTQH